MTKPYDYKKAKEKFRITNPKQINLKEISSIILLAPSKIEDFVLVTPAISALREAMAPEGKVTIVAWKQVAKLASETMCADEVLPISLSGFGKTLKVVARQVFDLFINFSGNRPLSLAAGSFITAKAKISYSNGEKDKFFNSIYNLPLFTISTPQHKIVKYLNLVRFIGANSYDFTPRIRLSNEDKHYAAEFIRKHNVDCERPLIGIHPTLKEPKKRWSFKKFHQAIDSLMEKDKATIVLFCHKDEKSQMSEFMHVTKNKCILADTNDYLKIAAIFRFLNCFICNETDFMHIAAPFTNVIAIWGGKEDPENNRPSGGNHIVLTPSDGIADSVPVSSVLDAVRGIIQRSGAE